MILGFSSYEGFTSSTAARLRDNQQLARIFLRASLPLLAKSQNFSNGRARVDENQSKEKRVRLILNGKVAGNDALRAAVGRQRAAGHYVEVRVTWEKGDARRFVSEADIADLVIAAGGDGTLNEVVHGLMDLSKPTRPILGIVPLGTANDFATGCGIPRDPAKALALCVRSEAVPIPDIGKAMTTGLSMLPALASVRRLQRRLHRNSNACLAVSGLHRDGCNSGDQPSSLSRKVTMPDREITGSGPVAIVGNGRQTGGGIQTLHAQRSTTVCSMCLSFVKSRRRRCWQRRENCNSSQPMATISLIGRRPGWRCIRKKQFQLTWMGSRYASDGPI